MAEQTTHKFQAAVTQVMSLVINSLYSNPEIFLRELISNASDALDKLRFQAVTASELMEEPLRVRLIPDRDAGTLTIRDTGIGMTRQELEDNLGTIARSGSQEFLKKLEEAKGDVALIGQFGVGFYSAYLVADQVEVVTRAAGSKEAFRWTSDAGESFTIESAERPHCGTDVVLHLKENKKEFLEPHRLRELVKRYSDYLGHPIEMEKLQTTASGQADTAEDSPLIVDPSRSAQDVPLVGGAAEFEKVNAGAALWERSASDVTEAQYEEFYKHLTHDWEPPLAHRHFKIEGTQLFSGLLFVPKRPPFDLFNPEAKHGVRLHVKRVFIMDDAEELLPKWLRFIRGVVDTEDLPLNVSRELLQDSKVVQTIRKQIIKQTLDMLEALSEGDDYEGFWRQYGVVLKEGLYFEADVRDRLAKLCRFETTVGEGLSSLEAVVERMKDGQDAIHYAIGPTRAALDNAPHLEGLKKRGFEVLLLTDPVDQWAVEGLSEFDGKKLVNAMAADLKLDGDDAEASSEDDASIDELLKHFRTVLQDQVSEVRVSGRLADSPVCLVVPDGGLSPYMERLLRMQSKDFEPPKRVLEVNPSHPLISELQRLQTAGDSPDKLQGWVELLYDQAVVAEGSPLEDPNRLLRGLTQLMTEAAARA